MPDLNKIYNANVYLDETKNLIGRAAEITLPTLQVETQEHKGLGMVGTLTLPSGLQALEASVKWTGFYADHLIAGANPFRSHRLQVRSSLETYTPEGRTEERPLVTLMTASWTSAALGDRKPQEAGEFDDELAVTYLKHVLDGRELVEIDVFNNIWRVDGQDVLAAYKQNIGG